MTDTKKNWLTFLKSQTLIIYLFKKINTHARVENISTRTNDCQNIVND